MSHQGDESLPLNPHARCGSVRTRSGTIGQGHHLEKDRGWKRAGSERGVR